MNTEDPIDPTTIANSQLEIALHRQKSLSERHCAQANNRTAIYTTLDATGVVLAINPLGAALLGYTSEELIGQPVSQIFQEEDWARVKAEFAVIQQDITQLFNNHVFLFCKDGSTVSTSLTVQAIQGIDTNSVFLLAGEGISQQQNLTIDSPIQAEKNLYRGDYLYRTLAENFPNGAVVLVNRDFRYIFAGGQELERVGLSQAALEGKTIGEVYSADFAKIIESKYRAAFAGTASVEEIPYGNDTYIVNTLPLKNEAGEIWAAMSTSQNITSRKRVEKALQESEERYRQLVELCPDGIFIQSEEKFVFVNQAALNIYGGNRPEDLIGKSIIDFVHPESKEVVKSRIKQLRDGEKAFTLVEEKLLRLDGTIVEAEVAAIPFNYQGKPAAQVVVRNISKRKQAEAALRRNEERLRLMLQNMPVMVDAFDDNFNIILWNRECELVTGYKAEEIVGNPQAMELLYPDPEYRHQMMIQWRECGHDYRNWEWQITSKDGKIKTVSWSNISQQFPLEGWASWGVGVDITEQQAAFSERQQAELNLRKQKELLQSIVDYTPVMLSLWDAQGKLQWGNHEMEKVLGWTVEEVRNRDILAELYPDFEYRQYVINFINSASERWGDFKTRVRDGSVIDTSWANVKLSDGSTIGIGQDITYRKEFESNLREKAKRERLIAKITQRIHQSLNLEEILDTTVCEVRQCLKVERVIIYRFEPDNSGIIVVESVNSKWKSILGKTIDDCYFRETYFELYQQGRVQVVEDIYTAGLSPCHVELLEELNVRANLVVPIVQEKKLWGLLVAQQCSSPKKWQPEEVNLLKQLATQTAIAIHQSELYEQAQTEIVQRQQAEAALRQQTEREKLMSAIAQRIRQSLKLEEILNTTVAEVREFLQSDRVLIYRIWSDGSRSAVNESVKSGFSAIQGQSFPVEMFTKELQDHYYRGRVIAIANIEQANLPPSLADFLRQLEVKAKLIVPILQGNSLWGLLVVHHCSSPKEWSTLETELLQQLAFQLSLAIEQAQRLHTIQESEERFRELAENICEVFFLMTPDRILYISPAYEEMWGCTCESLYQQPYSWMDLIHPDDQHQIGAWKEQLQQEIPFDKEYRIIRPDGTLRWIRTRTFPVLNPEGRIYRISGISEDITARKQAEEEVRQALEKEKELNELKSRFISMTSHEFRNPLNSILIVAQLLEEYSQTWTLEKKKRYLQRIQKSVKKLTQLLNEILFVGKAEAGKLEFNPVLINLEAFCRQIVREMRMIAGSNYTINFISQGNCQNCSLDVNLLETILTNLLSNGIKYSPSGGEINFELSCQQGEAIFRIQDCGIGIPETDRSQLFETFHRARNVGAIAGTGLGLAIVKNCVDLHQGTITFNSEVGVGTTFIVTLPVNFHVPA